MRNLTMKNTRLAGLVLILIPTTLLCAQSQRFHPFAAKPVTGLEVLSATVDLQPSQELTAHQITIQLHNVSEKTIVGYVLLLKYFDKDGKQIGDESGIGTDLVTSNPDDTTSFILPGQTAVSDNGHASADTLSVQVSVIGVVYKDRTYEGVAAGTLFDGRKQYAAEYRQALALLKSYPATPEETRKTIKRMLMIERFGFVTAALANNLHLRSVPDVDHLPADSFPREYWDDVKAELTREAAYWEALGQEVEK